jgi:hypothetical protein
MMLLRCDLRDAAFCLGMSEKMLQDRYGHFHPAFQAETRARLDGEKVKEVELKPVAGVFGANEFKSRAA